MRLPAAPRLLALALAAALALPAAASSPDAVEALIKSQDPGALARAEALVEAQASNARAWVLLTRARLQKGTTQRDLGQLIGVPQSHISKIEAGAVDLRISSLVVLARALDLSLELNSAPGRGEPGPEPTPPFEPLPAEDVPANP